MLWIQLFNLRIEYYDVSVLVVLTTTVGKSVKMDIQTIDTFRGKFAQDCAKINLNPTMVGSVWFWNHRFHVEYMKTYLISCNCMMMYCHIARECFWAKGETTMKNIIAFSGDQEGMLDEHAHPKLIAIF